LPVLDRVAIVLVEPREPGNIGAAARAMANMGLSRLVLVRPPAYLVDRPSGCSRGVRSRVRGRRRRSGGRRGFRPLPTTPGGPPAGPISPRELAFELPGWPRTTAILFGREESGLTNAELILQRHDPSSGGSDR
jgi:tRNA C32,U32 (ribose-2'-O)-methylase TrmJ